MEGFFVRPKKLLPAFTLIAFLAMPVIGVSTVAGAADIFIKKHKDGEEQDQPAAEPRPQVYVPGTTVAPPVPQTPPPSEAVIPPVQGQAQAKPPEKGLPPCTKEDAETILQFDKGFASIDGDTGSDHPDAQKWVSFLKDPEKVKELINLYIRCSAFLEQYKEAKNPSKKSKSKQTSTPVLRKHQ